MVKYDVFCVCVYQISAKNGEASHPAEGSRCAAVSGELRGKITKINRSRDQRAEFRLYPRPPRRCWDVSETEPLLPSFCLFFLRCSSSASPVAPHERWWNCAGKGASSRWLQNKWPRVTDLTHKSLGRLTERVGPSGPLNETQSECVCGCVWREAGRLHTFSLVPTSPPGTRPSPSGCCCCLCEMELEGEWVGSAEGRGGMNRKRKNTNFSEMEKNELACFWTDVWDWSRGGRR